MSNIRNDSCQCEGIRFTVTGEPDKAMLCYCIDCQKSAGSFGQAVSSMYQTLYARLKNSADRKISSRLCCSVARARENGNLDREKDRKWQGETKMLVQELWLYTLDHSDGSSWGYVHYQKGFTRRRVSQITICSEYGRLTNCID